MFCSTVHAVMLEGGYVATNARSRKWSFTLPTDVPNHKSAYCTLPRINTVNNSSNITNTNQRLIYTDNVYSKLLHTL